MGIIPLLRAGGLGARGALGRVAVPWALTIPLSMLISWSIRSTAPGTLLFALPGVALLAGAGSTGCGRGRWPGWGWR